MSYYTRCIDAHYKRLEKAQKERQRNKANDNIFTNRDLLYLMKQQWLYVFKLPGRIIPFVVGRNNRNS